MKRLIWIAGSCLCLAALLAFGQGGGVDNPTDIVGSGSASNFLVLAGGAYKIHDGTGGLSTDGDDWFYWRSSGVRGGFGLDEETFYKIWDSGNDGVDSLLDAGLFEGEEGGYYLDGSNHTNATYTYTLSVQDPTNGIVYWTEAMPAESTVTEVFAQCHGMTGMVQVIYRHRTNFWYAYEAIDPAIVLDTDGTADASFDTNTVPTAYKLGFIPTALSAFATTNLLQVDFQVTR